MVAGLSLVRIGQLIGSRRTDGGGYPQAWQFRRRLGRMVGRAAVVLGFAGPLLAAVGYLSAASF